MLEDNQVHIPKNDQQENETSYFVFVYKMLRINSIGKHLVVFNYLSATFKWQSPFQGILNN